MLYNMAKETSKMKKFIDSLDPKYTKICLYAGVTVVLVVAAVFLLYSSGGFWRTLWSLFTAVMRPLIAGGIICYLLLPIVDKIENKLSPTEHVWTRVLAIFLCYLIIFAVLAALLVALFFTVNKGIQNINFHSLWNFAVSTWEKLWADFHSILQSFESQLTSSLKNIPVSSVTGIVNAIIAGVADTLSGLMFGVIFSIYLLFDWNHIKKYWEHALHVLLGDKTGQHLKTFASDADMVFSGYIRGQFLDAFILGVLSSIIFLLAGTPNAVLVGVVVGIGNLIPYLGPVAGYFSLAVVCLIGGTWNDFLIGAVLLWVIMFIDGNFINPKLLSTNVKVHPLLVVVALIGGAAVSGFLGMIVAVPVAALIKLHFDRYIDAKEAADAGEADM